MQAAYGQSRGQTDNTRPAGLRPSFIQECAAQFSAKRQADEAVQNYCGCMVDYVMAQYGYPTFQRIDGAGRAGRNTPEVAALSRNIVENSLQTCPPPGN